MEEDAAALRAAGLRVTAGDLRCLRAGHVARIAIRTLGPAWDGAAPLAERLTRARLCLEQTARLAGAPRDPGSNLQPASAAWA